VLDPAVGSGAFLVEACRQLAEALVAAWEKHGGPPELPADEDALLHARRLVAQRCLYGLERNPMAADLAKLSLWLATLARDHEFTFLDHAIRHGDALVGLFRDEIGAVSWHSGGNVPFADMLVRDRIAKAEGERKRIREAVEGVGEHELRPLLARADKREQTTASCEVPVRRTAVGPNERIGVANSWSHLTSRCLDRTHASCRNVG
jgi:hypothetical protein